MVSDIKRGDVVELGPHRLMCGDCIEQMRLIDDESVDVVLTDPPYSSGTRREGAKGIRKSMNRGMQDAAWFTSDCLTTNGFVFLMRLCALEWHRLLKPGGHAFVFIDWRMMPSLAVAIESADLRHLGLIVWNKTYFGMGTHFRNQHELILHFTKGKSGAAVRHDVGNVLSHAPVRNGSHPTEKPVALLTELLSVVCDGGETVLDAFAGSGSALEAADALDCSFVGIERDTEYCAVIVERYRALVEERRLPLFEGNVA